MHLLRIASTCAAIALLCLPAQGGDIEWPPSKHETPPAHALPPDAPPAPPQAAFPPNMVRSQSTCVPCCSLGAIPTSYSGYPLEPAPIFYPPLAIPVYQGVADAPVEASAAPGILIAAGTKWLQRKEYEIATKIYDEATRLEPKNAVAYYCRGEARYRLGHASKFSEEFERAANDYTVATLLDGDFTDAYAALGDTYLQLKRYELAIQSYNEAIRRGGWRYFPHQSDSQASPGDVQIQPPSGSVPSPEPQSGRELSPDTTQARAHLGRAAAHAALANLYAHSNDQEAMRRESKKAGDDHRRAAQVRLAGAKHPPIATRRLEVESQSSH